MISKVFISGLAALACANLVLGDNHVSCSWYPDAALCTATVDSPSGKKYSAFQLQLAICAENNSGAGCTEDLPNVCKEVPITGLPLNVCLPALGPDSLSPADAPTLQSIEPCVGDPSPQCNDIRASFYDTLGCPDCTEAANEAVPIEADCIAASTKAACETAGAETAPTPGAAPEAAPVTTPAPTPAAPVTTPAVAVTAADAPVATATDGAPAPSGGEAMVEADSTSGARSHMAGGALALAGLVATGVVSALL